MAQKLVPRDVAQDRDVRPGRSHWVVLRHEPQSGGIPGLADLCAQRVRLPRHDLQNGRELGLVAKQAFVFDARVNHHALELSRPVPSLHDRILFLDGIPNVERQPFAARHATHDSVVCPIWIDTLEHLPDLAA